LNIPYLAAASVLVILGLLHSLLGERLVIGPLVAHEALPKLLGSRGFMGRVLRFTWHVTTIALWGIAGLLFFWSLRGGESFLEAAIVAVTLLLSAAISAVVARGKHFSWWVLLLVAVLVWWGAP